MPFKQRLGLALARSALRLTRNRELADVCSVLPSIPGRQFALSARRMDPDLSRLLESGSWLLWNSPDHKLSA